MSSFPQWREFFTAQYMLMDDLRARGDDEDWFAGMLTVSLYSV